ncbi:MAG: DUF4445 domain-containing protein [Parasporobacterium sp.]|nr:DUF4445 domain-containing protein [Parasporobacterium sp.]
MCKVKILPHEVTVEVEEGTDLLAAQIKAGINPDAPCGGLGKCGKCKADIIGSDGSMTTVLSCTYKIHEDLTIQVRTADAHRILETGTGRKVVLNPAVKEGYGAAYDVGTTTVVCYLLNLSTGERIATSGMRNPQVQFGGDVISRCEYAIENGVEALSNVIRNAMNDLLESVCSQAGINTEDVHLITVAGNTCMHHLFLNIVPKSLTVVPYRASVTDEIVMKAQDSGLTAAPDAILQILPNIAGFVGADTVGCLLATEFDKVEEMTLMIDIGTNGEMVMGTKDRMIACSTAAGPAFEGSKLDCGMRAMNGAIDHAKVEDGKLVFHIIGDGDVKGICGSGLMDITACALTEEIIDETGKIDDDHELAFNIEGSGMSAIKLTGDIYLSQKDIREVQLAKGAMAAGIELLAGELGIEISDIKKVLIAGAFGNYMSPHSACVIGLIPEELEDRIELIGNAAGEGAVIATLNHDEFQRAQKIRDMAEFLELAASPDFQDTFVDHLMFE